MASIGGPNLVNSGLIFGYDTGIGVSTNNVATRLYLGQPTTNTILSGATWGGDGSNQTVGAKGFTVITDESLKYNGYETVLWTPGTSRNVYLNGNLDISSTDNSTVWTFSCYMKYEDNSAITSLNVYLYYPSGDGSASGTITDCGDGWYRVSRTRTGSNNYISLAGFTTFSSNKRIYLSGPMLSKTSQAVPYVERSATRSVTQALIDAKRATTIDLSNVSFNSSAQPTFDGTDDYISLPNDSYPSSWANPLTIEVITMCPTGGIWCGATNSSGTSICGRGSYAGSHGMIRRPTDGQVSFWLRGDNGTLSPTVSGLLRDTYYHLVGTWDGTTANLYKNGVLIDTQSGARTGVPDGGNWVVGGGVAFGGVNGQFGTGNHDVIRRYNRALSSTEVQQNYQAYKSRFNM